MKQQQWVWVALWVCALGVGGCGGDEDKSALDPSTFAGMNADKLQYDCQHTIQCAAQRGEELVQNPVDTCIQETAKLLEAHPEIRTQYLSNVNRCQSRVVCDYKDCAITDAAGSYGQMQVDKITYKCQQYVECRRVNNMLQSDAATEVQTCIGTNIGYVDTFTTDQRAQFEANYATCTGRVACDFTTCFPW
jgi:hypothetical protein